MVGFQQFKRFFRLNFQPLFGKGACFSPKKAQLSHKKPFVILTQSDIQPQTFAMHKFLHQINNGCEIEMDATCSRTSGDVKERKFNTYRVNARKVCQWLRCVLHSVNRVGKIGTMWCMSVGQKKKFNRESKNPRH